MERQMKSAEEKMRDRCLRTAALVATWDNYHATEEWIPQYRVHHAKLTQDYENLLRRVNKMADVVPQIHHNPPELESYRDHVKPEAMKARILELADEQKLKDDATILRLKDWQYDANCVITALRRHLMQQEVLSNPYEIEYWRNRAELLTERRVLDGNAGWRQVDLTPTSKESET